MFWPEFILFERRSGVLKQPLSLVLLTATLFCVSCQRTSLEVQDFSRQSDLRDIKPDATIEFVSMHAPIPEPASQVANAEAEIDFKKTYPTDAMVGQVNGQAIYASTILGGIAPLLKGMGQELDEDKFRMNAGALINQQIRKVLFDTLLLAEAERALTVRESAGLKYWLDQEREKLIREYGQGSSVRANRMLKEEQQRDLEQTLEDKRKDSVIRGLLSKRIQPRINVTKQDVDKYFYSEAGQKEFNPPREMTLRLIQVKSDEAVARLTRRLKAGEPFEAVAKDPANRRRHNGGLFKVMDSNAFQAPELNEAYAELAIGEYAKPVQISETSHPDISRVFDGTWWVQMVTKPRPPKKLEDVQLLIEQKLRMLRYQTLSDKLREELYKDGTYTNPRQMVLALLDIAVVLYANRKQQVIESHTNELLVDSFPKEAILYVNGERKGVTPAVVNLKNGVHEIVLKKEGYQTHTNSIELFDRDLRTQITPVLKPKTN